MFQRKTSKIRYLLVVWKNPLLCLILDILKFHKNTIMYQVGTKSDTLRQFLAVSYDLGSNYPWVVLGLENSLHFQLWRIWQNSSPYKNPKLLLWKPSKYNYFMSLIVRDKNLKTSAFIVLIFFWNIHTFVSDSLTEKNPGLRHACRDERRACPPKMPTVLKFFSFFIEYFVYFN